MKVCQEPFGQIAELLSERVRKIAIMIELVTDDAGQIANSVEVVLSEFPEILSQLRRKS